MAKDFYDVLGVSRNATQDEIKKAFRKQARECHPDVNKDDPGAETRFKEINEAYECLSDADKRRNYDMFGSAKGGPAFGGQGDFSGFGGFESSFGDIFDMFFGDWRQQGGRGGGSKNTRGADLSLELTIEFEEAVFGAEKEVEIARLVGCETCGGSGVASGSEPERCTGCNGTGEIRTEQRTVFGTFVRSATCLKCQGTGRIITNPCADCNGQGRKPVHEKIKVDIPAGVDNGITLKLHGKGEAGVRGGMAGDLYVTLQAKPHCVFERQGMDLYCRFPITFAQAALGAELQVPTLEDFEEIKIKPGIQTGTVFKIRGKGVPSLRSHARGDIIIQVVIETPQKLTDRQKELLLEFAHESGEELHHPAHSGFFDKIKDAFAGK
ncbi:MAG: molecular chaperone DnaJ [Rubrobacteridae bacterium]|nr:molecular chaperone DnaJ [Rubrobacteridae bacterium]